MVGNVYVCRELHFVTTRPLELSWHQHGVVNGDRQVSVRLPFPLEKHKLNHVQVDCENGGTARIAGCHLHSNRGSHVTLES